VIPWVLAAQLCVRRWCLPICQASPLANALEFTSRFSTSETALAPWRARCSNLGIPTEGYGFSNDAGARLGPPSFSAASFPYDGRMLDLTISLRY
jgi:hypothetical protein